jgi:hypothetical protein
MDLLRKTLVAFQDRAAAVRVFFPDQMELVGARAWAWARVFRCACVCVCKLCVEVVCVCVRARARARARVCVLCVCTRARVFASAEAAVGAVGCSYLWHGNSWAPNRNLPPRWPPAMSARAGWSQRFCRRPAATQEPACAARPPRRPQAVARSGQTSDPSAGRKAMDPKFEGARRRDRSFIGGGAAGGGGREGGGWWVAGRCGRRGDGPARLRPGREALRRSPEPALRFRAPPPHTHEHAPARRPRSSPSSPPRARPHATRDCHFPRRARPPEGTRFKFGYLTKQNAAWATLGVNIFGSRFSPVELCQDGDEARRRGGGWGVWGGVGVAGGGWGGAAWGGSGKALQRGWGWDGGWAGRAA